MPHPIDTLDLPVPAWQEPILDLLLEFDYHPAAIRLALKDLSMWGSAECSNFIDREHRALVENLIPSNACHWPVNATNDFFCWSLGPEA